MTNFNFFCIRQSHKNHFPLTFLIILASLILTGCQQEKENANTTNQRATIQKIVMPDIADTIQSTSSSQPFYASIQMGDDSFEMDYHPANRSFSITLNDMNIGNRNIEVTIAQSSAEFGLVPVLSLKKEISLNPGPNDISFSDADLIFLNDDQDEFNNWEELRHKTNPYQTEPNYLATNPTLTLAIKTQLQLSDEDPIPYKQLRHITALDLSLLTTKSRISDLSGIRYFYNLQKLNLNEQWQIEDFSELQYLSELDTLNLNNTSLDSLTPFKNLTNLEELTFDRFIRFPEGKVSVLEADLLPHSLRNTITDLSPLTNLTQLKHLEFSNQSIVDISILKNFPQLTTLKICGNAVTDIQPLKELTNLEHLSLGNNFIPQWSTEEAQNYFKDIGMGVAAELMIGLFQLNAVYSDDTASELGIYCHNPVTNISFITSLPKLTELNIATSGLTDFGFIEEFENIKHLDISNNPILSLSFIEDLFPNVESLILAGIDLSHINKIPGDSITYLDLGYTQIETLPEISAKSSLKYLNLIANKLEEVPDLSVFSQIEELNLGHNQLTSIAFSTPMPNLTTFYGNNNQLTEFPSTSQVPNLRYLELGQNKLSNVDDFSNLTQLTYLNLSQNEIENTDFLTHLNELTRLYLTSNNIKTLPTALNMEKLVHLLISNNQLTQTPKLNTPRLTDLDFSRNRLTSFPDLNRLSELTHFEMSRSFNEKDNPMENQENLSALPASLQRLELSNCNINNIAPLGHLTRLSSLILTGNKITSLEQLPVMPYLHTLNAAGNLLSGPLDLSLKFPGLDTIDLQDNALETLKISHQTPLIELNLNDNHLSSLAFLGAQPELTTLYISDNQISDIAALEHSPRLWNLSAINNNIESITPLENLNFLTTMFITGNSITHFPLGFGKSSLQILHMSDNPIVDEIRIENYSELNSLAVKGLESPILTVKNSGNLSNVQIHRHKFELIRLENLESLSSVSLSSNSAYNVEIGPELSTLQLIDTPNLKKLNLSGHPNLTALTDSNQENLTELNIINSNLDSSVLLDFPGIEHLLLDMDTIVTDEHINENQTLRELTVFVEDNRSLDRLYTLRGLEKISLQTGFFSVIKCDEINELRSQLPGITITAKQECPTSH